MKFETHPRKLSLSFLAQTEHSETDRGFPKAGTVELRVRFMGQLQPCLAAAGTAKFYYVISCS